MLVAKPELPENFDEQKFYQDYHSLSNEVVTPHLLWAKKSIWAGLRVLIIAPSWGQRETVELQQRFDFQVSSLMTLRHNAFAGLTAIGTPLSPEQVSGYFEADLLGNSYDVIVMSRTAWSLYPSHYRYDLLRKVYEEGTGLLLIGVGKHDELEQLFSKTAWKPDLSFADLEALSYVKNGLASKTNIVGVQFGKGRVLRFDWRSMSAQMILTPWGNNYDFNWEYEHYLALCSKAILAVSGKYPDLRWQVPEKLKLTAGLDRQKLVMELIGDVEEQVANIELQAFSALAPKGHSLGRFTAAELKNGAEVYSALNEGSYLLLATCHDASGRLCAWEYFPLQINATFKIASVQLNRDALAKAGEMVQVKVAMEGVFTGALPLTAKVYDVDSRLVYEQEMLCKDASTVEFSFPAPYPLNSSLFNLQLQLANFSQQTVDFTVQGRERPVFSFGSWVESQSCYMSYLYYRSMAANGIDGIFYSIARGDRAVAAPLLAKTKLFSIPHYNNYTPDRDRSQPERPVNRNNLNDPKFLSAQREKMRDLATVWSKYDIYSYTDGSDKSRGGNSFDELSIKTFRDWMRQRHGSIKAMNQKLGSDYQDFSELQPVPLLQAKKEQKLPLWLEYNRFFEQRFLNYFTEMQAVGREVDLNGECYLGPDGFGRLDPFEFAGMYDLLKTVTYFNLYTYQDPPQMEIARSLLQYCPEVKYRTIYAGSYGNQYMNYSFMRSIPWFMLFHNYTGFFWYMGNGKLTFSSEGCMAFMPDLRPSEGFQVAAQQITELRQGLAPLVAVSKRRHDNIAILYCNTSVAAATVDQQENTLRQSLSELQNLLEDCGLQYDYIPTQELEAGALQSNYRILFMPNIRSLSSKTLGAIEAFVDSGGLVIADLLPGKYDDFLRPVATEQLATRFANSDAWRLSDWKSYSKVRKHSAKGEAYRQEWLTSLSGQLQRLTRWRGNGIPGVEKIEYQLPSGGWLLAAINYQKEERELVLELPEGKVLYDVRAAKQIVYANSHTFLLSGGETKVFCLQELELPKLQLQKPKTVRLGGMGTFSCKNGNISNAYYITVYDANKKERKEYSKTILNTDEFQLRPALNDPEGNWQLQVRDTISGQVSNCEFLVEPKL